MTARWPIFVVSLLLLTSGCDRTQKAPTPDPPASTSTIPDIPPFPLDTLELAVRQQIENAITAVEKDPRDAYANGRLGMLFHTYDIYTQADICYQRAIMFAATDNPWHYYRGRVLADLGQWSTAAQSLSHHLERRPKDFATLLALADIDFRQNRFDDARNRYEKLLQQDPESPHALVGFARCQIQAGNIDAASESLTAALEASPDYGLAHYILAQVLRKQGQLDHARDHASLAEKHRDHEPPIDDPLMQHLDSLAIGAIESLHRGIELMQAGQPKQALPLLIESARINPDLPETHAQLGTAYLLVGEFDNAEHHLKQALKLSPVFVEARYNLGLLNHRRREFASAVAHFRAVLDIEPAHFEANLGFGTDLQKLHRHAAAIQPLQHAARIRPDDARAHKRLAAALMHVERYADALATLEAGQRALPDDGSITDRLARLLATCPDDAIRDPLRAIALATQLCARTGNRIPQTLDTLAAAYAAADRFPDAINTANLAIKQAREQNKPGLVMEMEERLQQYQAGQPYRFTPQAE